MYRKSGECFDAYQNHVAIWVAKTFIQNTKVLVDHSSDPDWDTSGHPIYTDTPFNSNDYTTLESFLKEHNGQTEPSYMSGCGLFHLTYRSELEDLTLQWTGELQTQVVNDLLKENKTLFKEFIEREKHKNETVNTAEDISSLISSSDIIGDDFYDIYHDLLEEIANVDLSFLLKIGEAEAYKTIEENKRIAAELKIEKARKDQHGKEASVFVLDELKNRFLLKYQVELPKRIEKQLYVKKVKSILSDMVRDGIDECSIQLSADYLPLSLSHSVLYDLKTAKHSH